MPLLNSSGQTEFSNNFVTVLSKCLKVFKINVGGKLDVVSVPQSNSFDRASDSDLKRELSFLTLLYTFSGLNGTYPVFLNLALIVL